MAEYHHNLATYVEAISDDFQSTFTVKGPNTLLNMLGFEGDFDKLTKIIQNYIPGAKVKYTKTNQFKEAYDIYIIELS